MSPKPVAVCRVLYVDDTPEDQRILAEAIAGTGVAVDLSTTSTAAGALALLRSGDVFDILLLDWNLPAVSGEEFLATVRAVQPDLPVMILTGEPGTVDLSRAKELGVPTVLRKPLMLEDWERLAVGLYERCEAAAVR